MHVEEQNALDFDAYKFQLVFMNEVVAVGLAQNRLVD
jgi:hypothetical protein